jgi:hypothetical protein
LEINAKEFVAQGILGKAIGEAMAAERLVVIKRLSQSKE